MSKRKLLLADDSVTIQKVVDLTFQDEGFEVISVGDGNSAMEKLMENKPDLVLADVNMPGLNGYEICEKIKSSDDFRDIPVVLLVGSFEPFDESEADRVGADAHLTKPFQSISQLVNVVFGLIGPGSIQSERAMSAAQSGDNGTHELPTTPPDFGSLAADDQMIEKDQISSIPVDEVSRFETQPLTETPVSSVENTSSFETFNSVEEANFTEFDSGGDNDPAVFSNQELESDEDSSDHDSDFKEFSIVESSESYGVTTGTMSDEIEASDESETADEFEAPQPEDENKGFDGFDTQSFDGADTAELQTPGNDQFSLDEFNLLEVPIADGESGDDDGNEDGPEAADETTFSAQNTEDSRKDGDSQEGSFAEVTSPIEETADEAQETDGSDETGLEFNQEEDKTFESAGSQSLEDSDEVVERIARRVVEMMTDKVVREVAWEVVPQMSDLIIKEMAREKMKD